MEDKALQFMKQRFIEHDIEKAIEQLKNSNGYFVELNYSSEVPYFTPECLYKALISLGYYESERVFDEEIGYIYFKKDEISPYYIRLTFNGLSFELYLIVYKEFI